MGRVTDYILQAGEGLKDGIRFVALDTRGNRHAGWSLALTMRAIWVIVMQAAAGHVAMVHVNMAERASVFRKALVIAVARLLGIPVVLHLHAAELIGQYDGAGAVTRALIAAPFRMANCTVVLGGLWKRWLVETFALAPERVEVVHNGVPGTFASGVRQPSGEGRILFLGNLTERKGVSDLLRALAHLPATTIWHATFAGGGDVERFRALAGELGIAGQVSFTGWVGQGEAGALVAQADLLVLPSYNEGLPLVILEALGKGTPVVCTPVGAIPEVLDDNRTVLMVPPGDHRCLAEKISILLNDAARWRALSEAGGHLFEERFTLTAFTNTLFSVYRTQCGIDVTVG